MFMSTPLRLSAYCKNNEKTFQDSKGQFKCDLKFGSWLFDGHHMDIHNRTSEVDVGYYFPNNYWDLMDTNVNKHVVSYDCCPEPYVDVTFTFNLKKKYNEL